MHTVVFLYLNINYMIQIYFYTLDVVYHCRLFFASLLYLLRFALWSVSSELRVLKSFYRLTVRHIPFPQLSLENCQLILEAISLLPHSRVEDAVKHCNFRRFVSALCRLLAHKTAPLRVQQITLPDSDNNFRQLAPVIH